MSKVKKLYDILSAKYDFGDYDAFASAMGDEAKRRKIYDIASEQFDFGDYDSFNSNLGYAPSAEEVAEEIQPKDETRFGILGKMGQYMGSPSSYVPMPQAEEREPLTQAEIDERAAMRKMLQDSGTIDRMEGMEKEARKNKFKAFGEALAYTPQVSSFGVASNIYKDTEEQLADAQRAMEASEEHRQNKAMEQTLDVALDKARAGEWGGIGENNVGNGIVDFGLGLWDSATRMSTWDFGVSDTLNGLTIAQVVKKWEEDPESLTATERNLLDAMGMATAVQEAYQDQVGIGYAVGESLPQSAGFMASMYLNPASGLGKSLARQAVKKYGRQSIAKNLARIGGDIAETAIMTATTGGGRVVADAFNRINGSTVYDIDPETGIVMYGGQEDQKTVGEAVAKAIGSNFIENYSEALGEYFDPLLGMSRRLAAGGLRKINLNKWADALSDVQPSQMAASIRSLREKAKFGGVFGEIMEEEVGMALNAITVGDYTFSKEEAEASKGKKQWVFDLETQLTTALSCAIMSGAITGVETIGNVRYRREMEKSVADAEKAARAAVGDEMIAQIDQASPEGMVDILRDAYMDQNLSLQQKRLLAEYATQRVRMQYYNAADAKARGQVNVTRQNTIDAYEAGRHAQLPQYYNIDQEYRRSEAAINERENAEEIWDAIRLMNNMDENERQSIMRDFSKEDQELIRNWRYNAYRWQGAVNHRAEQVEDLVDEYAGQVNPHTRPDGTVTTAILGDNVVYVMSEAENGDAVVETYDGYPRFCKMSDLEHVQQYNAEELIERFRQNTTAVVNQETEKNLSYPAEVQEPAQGVAVETLDGKQWQVAATDGENVEIVGSVFDKKSGQWIPNSGDYRKMTREQFMDWQKAELDRKKANTYEQGDELTFYVGGEPISAEITGIDPDGNYYVHVSNLVEGLDKAVSDVYTAEELRKLTTPSSKVSEKTTENEGMPIEEIKQSVSEEITDSQIEENVTEPTAEVAESVNTALSRVPKDAKGNPLYEQTDADTAWGAIMEQTEGDAEMAQRIAEEIVADKKSALAKMQKGKPKKGATVAEKIANEKAHIAAIAQAEAEVAAWEKIAQTEARRREAAMSEADRYAAEMEQKNISEGLSALGEPQSLQEYVLAQLAGGAYKLRWNDKENDTKGFGSHTGLSTEEMKARLSMVDNKNGLTPEEIAHSIVENMDASFGEVDVMDVTNMVIDAVSTYASRRAMLNGMVESRAELIRQQEIAEQEAKDAWYMEQYHATEEELAAYNEYLAEFAEEIYGEDSDYEQRIATFAEIQLEYDNQGTDAGLRSSADQGAGLASDREGGRSVGETEQLDRREVLADAAGVAEAEDGRTGSSVSAQSDAERIGSIKTELGVFSADNAAEYANRLYDIYQWKSLEEANEVLRAVLRSYDRLSGQTLGVLPYLDQAQKLIKDSFSEEEVKENMRRTLLDIGYTEEEIAAAERDGQRYKADMAEDAAETVETLENGDVRRTNRNSNGEIATVVIERDGNVISVDTYEDGALFERTDYDANGNATKVTRYKDGEVVSEQEYKDGKRKVTANYFEMAEEAQMKRKSKKKDDTTRRSIQESPAEADRVSGEIFGGESLGEGESVSARGDGGVLEEGAGKKKRTAKSRRQSDNRQEARDGKAERLSRGVSAVQQQAIDEYTRTNPWDANFTDDERDVLNMYRMATINELDELAHKLADKINSGKATQRDRMRYDVLAAYAKSGELKAVADAMGVEYDSPVSLDTIKSLFETFNSDPELAVLFNRVFPLVKEINPTIVYRRFTEKDLDEGEDVSPDDILGQYSLQDNLIEYNRNQIDSNHCTEQEKASTIVHEMIHAVARYAIRVQEAHNNGVELDIQLPKRLLDAAQALIEVYDAIKDNEIFNDDRYESGKMYGVSSVHEMLSELADPEFREKLKQVSIENLPSDKKGRVRDALRAIKDFIHRMFGWDSSSAYARTKRALDKLIDNYDSAGYNKARELSDDDFAQQIRPSSEENLRFREGDNQDAAYMDAVERGDMEAAQRMVDEAARKAMKRTKVVDKDKQPVLMSHHTDAEGFYVFDRGKIGTGQGQAFLGAGFNFSRGSGSSVYGSRNIQAYLDARKPLRSDRNTLSIYQIEQIIKELNAISGDNIEHNFADNISRAARAIYEYGGDLDTYASLCTAYSGETRDVLEVFEKLGYDSTIEYDDDKRIRNAVVFNSNQIKSADPVTYDDNGNIIPLSERFNLKEEDIRFRDGAPFFSNAERAVENIKQNKATPEQWLAMIKKGGGLKAGEDKWMGLSDWLTEKKEAGVKSLTKDEVLQFIRENQIEIEEVEYGEYADDFTEGDVVNGVADGIAKSYGEAFSEAFMDVFEVEVDDYYNHIKARLISTDSEAVKLYNEVNDDKLSLDEDGYLNDQDFKRVKKWANDVAQNASRKVILPMRLNYTTEGLDNKKEIAFVVPHIESWNQSDNIHFGDAGKGRAVAWVRFGETTDEDGKRVLVIDEVQSKRHDEGRAKGYRNIDAEKRFSKLKNQLKDKYPEGYVSPFVSDKDYQTILSHSPNTARLTPEEQKEYKKLQKEIGGGIPNAPFGKNYHELVMKRMLRYAAENGFDKVAWTKGAQQAQRYNLGESVDYIFANPSKDGSSRVAIRTLNNGEDIEMDVNNDGMVISGEYGGESLEGKNLSEIVGKEMAVKILSAEQPVMLSGEGLRIGDDGRNALYDEMIPRFMNKYTKKWGTKVGEVTLPEVEKAGRTMWSVDVTPEMKESVMQGQPMFREGMGAISDREVSYENDPIAKFQGKPRYYGKRAAAFAERERRRMEQAAKEAAEMLGIEVEIITDASTLKGRKAKAKGWYDISNKKVVVVVPNHVSMGDAVRTVLHEGVAHHGLRELFGDGFDAMLDNIYNNVAPELKARIDAIAERTGVSTSVATEEYLASLAETTNFEEAMNRGWWLKIKQFFVDMLRKLSMPGLILKEELTDNELRYLLWRSYQNLVDPNSYLKPLGYIDDVAKQKELKVGNYAENTMATQRAAEMSEAEEWSAITMQRIEELEAQAAQLENEIAEMEADRDADDANRYDIWEQQIDPLREQLEDVYAELEGLYSLEAEAEEMSMTSEEGLRYRSKDSTRRQERNRINNNYENAVSLLFGVDKKKVREERIAREKKRREDAKEIYDSVLSGDFNDVTLQKINDYIDDATPQNPFGRRISQRLPQKLERSLHEGARTNAVDALFSRISESAVPANERISEAGRRKAEERKKELLKGWAIATGNWHTDLSAFVDDTTPIGEGTDSKVYLANDGAHVIKTSKGKPYGKRFRPDMDNIALFNRVFYNSRYEIVGYGEIDGEFVRILKQPIVDFTGTTPLTPDERVEYMKGLKFEPINDSKTAFSNGEIVISDLQKSNIIKDAAGNVRVIDADAKLHTKDVGGNYTYPPVEADLPQNENLQEKDDIAIEDSANIESHNAGEIIAEVERESAALGVPVRIVRSVDELPDDANTRKRAIDGGLKGYFDTETGEVVLYEPNATDANDAKRTVLHEVVGHKGLRELIGEENYDKMMVRMLYLLPEAERMEVLRRAERHGWNAAIAMDEYLAEKAEEDATPTWWGRINSWVRTVLRNRGFDVKLTDADVKYLLWRSRKKLMGDDVFGMAFNNKLKRAARQSARAEAWAKDNVTWDTSDSAVRERGVEQGKEISDKITEHYEKYAATTNAKWFIGGLGHAIAHMFDGGPRRLLNDLSEKWFENIRVFRRLEEGIEKAEGKALKPHEMIHKSLNAEGSINSREMEISNDRYFAPLAELVGKILGRKIGGRKIEVDDIERYLICKHAPERNKFLMGRAHAENRRKKIAERAKELMEGNMTKEEAIAQATSEYALHQSDFRDDYSGLTELFKGVTIDGRTPTIDELEQLAAEEVARFEEATKGLYGELWSIIRDLNNDTIKKAYESGLISRSLFYELKKRFQYYVPLQGAKNDYAPDIYDYVTNGMDVGPLQTVVKTAFGTKHQARNILGSMFAMNTAAITQGNHNRVKQLLYNLALNHNTGVLQIVDLWQVEENGEWKAAPAPVLNEQMTKTDIQKTLTDYHMQMRELEKEGKARRVVNSMEKGFGLNIDEKDMKNHYIKLLVNGREQVIWVNGNPKLAQAMNGLLDKKLSFEDYHFKLGDIIIDGLNKALARTQTSINPEFLLGNAQRDLKTATESNLVQYGPKYQAKFMKYYGQLMPISATTNKDMRKQLGTSAVGIWRLFMLDRNTHSYDNYGKPILDMNNRIHREFLNFLNYGGKTGYVELRQAEDIQTRIKKLGRRERSMFNRLLLKYPAELVEGTLNTVEKFNEGIENATRFAAYLTMRDMGKSVQEAIYEAKEVSVNFNMHGSGGWGNALFRKGYNYFNVSLQALRKEKVKFGTSPWSALSAKSFLIAHGFIWSMIMYSLSGDDDDENEYASLSDWNRWNYINIFNPIKRKAFTFNEGEENEHEGFFHWALPQDQRAFYAIGCIIYEMAEGYITTEHGLRSILAQMNNYTPLEVVSSVNTAEPDKSFMEDIKEAFVPSLAQPFHEVKENEDFLGRPINNKNEWNEYEPEWQRAGYRTPEWAINVSKALSKATGGEDHKRGKVEINPSDMFHILNSYGGGTVDFIEKVVNLGELIAGSEKDKENELRDYPFVSKVFVETSSDHSKQRIVNDRYDMYEVSYETTKNRVKGADKDYDKAKGILGVELKYKKISEAKYLEELEKIATHRDNEKKRISEDSDYYIYEIYEDYKKRMNKAKDKRKEAYDTKDEEAIKIANETVFEIKKAVVDAIMKKIEEDTKD